MNFPVVILLGVYALFFLGLMVMALSHLVLVWRYGEHSFLASFTSGLFLVGIGIIILGTFLLLAPVDWSQAYEFTIPTFGVTAPEQSL